MRMKQKQKKMKTTTATFPFVSLGVAESGCPLGDKFEIEKKLKNLKTDLSQRFWAGSSFLVFRAVGRVRKIPGIRKIE